MGDLSDKAPRQVLEDAVRENVEARNRLIPDAHMDWRQVIEELDRAWERLRPWVKDVSLYLDEAIKAGRRVMFEGAQGTLLDIDHGTYPFVTSSNATTGGICTGLGIGPRQISGVMGVAKAYATRVGSGPFPSELLDEMGQRLRDGGSEYGSPWGSALSLTSTRILPLRRATSVASDSWSKPRCCDGTTSSEVPAWAVMKSSSRSR